MSQGSIVPGGIPTPPPGPRRRTPVVTAAAGLLITSGALTFLAGLIVVLAGSDVLIGGEPVGSATRTIAWIAVVVGVVDILVGALVFALVPLARFVGFGLAGMTVAVGVATLSRGISSSFLQVLLGALTIWALAAAGPAFHRR